MPAAQSGMGQGVPYRDDDKIFAYNLSTKAPNPSRDFNTLETAGNDDPHGIWSDGETMWVADTNRDRIMAYNLSTKARDPARDFETLKAAGNTAPRGIWSDGVTMWVVDRSDDKLYAYNMPSNGTTPGASSLTVTWNAPSSEGGSAITAYDLRYVPSDAPSKADAEWTVVQDVWTTGSGTLSYELTGLTDGTPYDVQVGAINDAGEGPWSATATGTSETETQAGAPTDFNGDGRTDFVDFFLFIDAFDAPSQAKLVALAEEMLGLPSETELQQNAPNPFNSETVISWFFVGDGSGATGGILPDGTAGGGPARRPAGGRPPPRSLGRPRRRRKAPRQRRIPVPAGDGRRREGAQADPAALIGPVCQDSTTGRPAWARTESTGG